jgi:uncharacterized membrane protein YgcG
MGTQEWLLLGVVVLVPLVIAIAVTLWTLEQAIKRNRKNRPDRAARRVSEPVADPAPVTAGATTHGARNHDDRSGAEHVPGGPVATPGDASGGVGFSGDGGSSGDSGSSSD